MSRNTDLKIFDNTMGVINPIMTPIPDLRKIVRSFMILRPLSFRIEFSTDRIFLSIELANFFCDTPQGITSVLPGQYIPVQLRTFEGAVRTNCCSRGAISPCTLFLIILLLRQNRSSSQTACCITKFYSFF